MNTRDCTAPLSGAVHEIETAWIPLSDGSRLAARIWLPACAKERQVGAVMEYIPYRRRDLSRSRDEPMHRYFAEHGYASLRVDLRGSGDSDGLLADEYTRQEWDDGVEAIAWIAAQRWCNGSVGMVGLSWGGFTALQIAALRPPALKAIITVGSTDDRYRDDMHFTGGMPDRRPDGVGHGLPVLSGPASRSRGGRQRVAADVAVRLDNLSPPVHRWLRHQRRDAYWKHGSVCERFADIEAAVYAVGGWADGYTNSVFRLMTDFPHPAAPPWAPGDISTPTKASPGPQSASCRTRFAGGNAGSTAWDNGVTDEPHAGSGCRTGCSPVPTTANGPALGRYRCAAFLEHRPGHLSSCERRPPAGLGRHGTHRDFVASDRRHRCRRVVRKGQSGGRTAGPARRRLLLGVFRFRAAGRAIRDARCSVLEIELDCDQSVALLAARLNDVSPDGSSLRVSYAVLNLTHRNGHEAPAPLVPGKP